jgi:hypothetical protein
MHPRDNERLTSMKALDYLAAALMIAITLAGGQALAANTCQTDKLSCPTAMPVGGYCECTSHGTTEGGEVVPPRPHEHYNASTGGCGVNPGAPGCR